MNKETYLDLYLSEKEIAEFVGSNTYFTSHQDIMDNLGLSSHYQLVLKRLFPHLPKRRSQKYRRIRMIKSKLADVDLLVVRSKSDSGKLFLEPPFWDTKKEKPKIIIDHSEIPEEKLEVGDKILVRIKPVNLVDRKQNFLSATFLKVIDLNARRCLGIVRKKGKETSVLAIKKIFAERILVKYPHLSTLKEGDIVEINIRDNEKKSKAIIDDVLRVHGSSKRTDLFSFLAKKEFSLQTEFPDSVREELPSIIKKKKNNLCEDLTHIPFVTIDPIDARDKDDAVYAVFSEKDQGKGSFCEIWIAIADVSLHVPVGSCIDQEALRRGNSTYFTDSVIPMLPEELSNDLCSLEENKVRHSITLRIKLTKSGEKISHKFIKSIISVRHNCSYEEVENSQQNSEPDEIANDEKRLLLENLFKANSLLAKSKSKAINLNVSEPIFRLSKKGDVIDLYQEKELKSHKIIENFMIAANTCAAETLSKSGLPVIYRVHEPPPADRLKKLSKRIFSLGIKGARKNIALGDFSQILNLAQATQFREVTSLLILQAMTQAYYTTKEVGHFGLSLKKYVHFTSPIRRYTDLLTHRLLYMHLGWSNENNFLNDTKSTELICLHLSTKERNSSMAERQSNHRHIASFMESLIGRSFVGIVYFSKRNLIFFLLRQLGIQGVCNHKYYYKNIPKKLRKRHLKGKKLVKIGDTITVKLVAADTLSGNLSFELE